MLLFYQHKEEMLSINVSATSQIMNVYIYKTFTVDVFHNSFSRFTTKRNWLQKLVVCRCNFLELEFSQDRAVQGHALTVDEQEATPNTLELNAAVQFVRYRTCTLTVEM